MTPQGQKSAFFFPKDDGSELVGLTFIDDGEFFHVTGTHKEDGQTVVDYKDKKGANHYSTIQEVRQWIAQTALNQAANAIQPTRTLYINKLAEEVYRQITTDKTYNVKLLKGTTVKPTSYKKAGNMTETQWFHAEDKEREGCSNFRPGLDCHSKVSRQTCEPRH